MSPKRTITGLILVVLTLAAILVAAFSGTLFKGARAHQNDESLYRAALAKNPAAAEPAEKLAQLLIDAQGAKAYPEATEILRSVLRSGTHEPSVACKLASLLLAQGQAKEAQETLEQSLKINPTDAQTNEQLADMLVASIGSIAYPTALPFYQTAFKSAPQRASVVKSLAHIYMTSGKLADARSVLESGLALNGKDAELHAALADVLTLLHDYPAADTHFELATSLDSADTQTLVQWSIMLLDDNRAAQAQSNLQRALTLLQSQKPAPTDLNPRLAQCHFHLGRALRSQGLKLPAMDEFVAAYTLDPDLAAAFYEAGNTILAEHEDQAERLFRAALHVDPHNLDALIALARVLVLSPDRNRRDPLEAAGLLRTAIEDTHGRDLSLLAGYGDVLERCGFYEQAADAYQRALELKGPTAANPTQREAILQRMTRNRMRAATSLPAGSSPLSIDGLDLALPSDTPADSRFEPVDASKRPIVAVPAFPLPSVSIPPSPPPSSPSTQTGSPP